MLSKKDQILQRQLANAGLVFYAFFVLFALDKCCVLLTYPRQSQLNISSSHNHLDFTPFTSLELRRQQHRQRHNSQEGPEALSAIEPADPRRALQRCNLQLYFQNFTNM